MSRSRPRPRPAPAQRLRAPGSSSPAHTKLAVTLGGAAVVLGLNLALKAVGALQQAAVARVFGAGPETDAYAAAAALPTLLNHLLVLGPLSLALTPALVTATPDRTDDGQHLVSAALSWTFAAALVLPAAGVPLAPLLVAVLAPGLAPATAALSVDLLRVLLAAVGCAAAAAVLRGVLHAWGLFAAPLLAYLGAALLLLAATLVAAPVWGVAVLPWASLTGALAGVTAQLVIVRRRAPAIRPFAVWGHPKLAAVGRLLVLTGVVMAALQGMGLIARHLASYHGTGALALMEYALSFDRLVGGTGAAAIATVFYPFLVLRRSQGDHAALAAAAGGAVRSVALVTVLMVGAAVALGEPLVRLWLQRGRFGPDETAAVVLLVRALAPALVAWSIATPIVYAFHAVGHMRAPVVMVLAGAAATAVAAQTGSAVAGLVGIGVGVSAGSAITCAALGWLLLRRLRVSSAMPALRIARALAATGAAATGAMTLVAMAAAGALAPGLLADGVVLAAGGGVGMVVALAGGTALGIPEARRLTERLVRLPLLQRWGGARRGSR